MMQTRTDTSRKTQIWCVRLEKDQTNGNGKPKQWMRLLATPSLWNTKFTFEQRIIFFHWLPKLMVHKKGMSMIRNQIAAFFGHCFAITIS